MGDTHQPLLVSLDPGRQSLNLGLERSSHTSRHARVLEHRESVHPRSSRRAHDRPKEGGRDRAEGERVAVGGVLAGAGQAVDPRELSQLETHEGNRVSVSVTLAREQGRLRRRTGSPG